MKRMVVVFIVLLYVSLSASAADTFYSGLSNAQRYDLADAYNRVADRYVELNDMKKADGFRAMVQVIYPDFGKAERPAPAVETRPAKPPVKQAVDSSGGDASLYYFNKLLRGVFDENISLTLSAVAETLYLPLFDAGIDKAAAAADLKWFFEEYDIKTMAPSDVFRMETIIVTPLDNGYWRLDVRVMPEYADALPEITFWGEKMGFYFRKFPEGWRLAAIGPVA
jgi:hypothetical protein